MTSQLAPPAVLLALGLVISLVLICRWILCRRLWERHREAWQESGSRGVIFRGRSNAEWLLIRFIYSGGFLGLKDPLVTVSAIALGALMPLFVGLFLVGWWLGGTHS